MWDDFSWIVATIVTFCLPHKSEFVLEMFLPCHSCGRMLYRFLSGCIPTFFARDHVIERGIV